MKETIKLTIDEIWTVLNNGKCETEDYIIELK